MSAPAAPAAELPTTASTGRRRRSSSFGDRADLMYKRIQDAVLVARNVGRDDESCLRVGDAADRAVRTSLSSLFGGGDGEGGSSRFLGALAALAGDDDERLREAFNMFDADRSGSIGIKEIGSVMGALGFAPTAEEMDDMVAAIDRNDDGKLDFEEFRDLVASNKPNATWASRAELSTVATALVRSKGGVRGGLRLDHAPVSTAKVVEAVSKAHEIGADELRRRRREWYLRRFSLWVPKREDYTQDEFSWGAASDFELVGGSEGAIREILLPIQGLLDRILLSQVRSVAMFRVLAYIVYMVLFFTMLVLQRNPKDAFMLETALEERLKFAYPTTPGQSLSFENIRTVPQFWEWMQYGMMNIVFKDDTWYNGDAIESSEGENYGYIFWYSKPVSAFELVQHRIQSIDSKRMNPKFAQFYPSVWPRVPFFSDQLGSQKVAISRDDLATARFVNEERTSFGPPSDPHKYKWKPDKNFEFGGGGYYVEFSTDRVLSQYMLDELKHDRWLDKQTRRVMAVFPVFNANVRLFALITLIIEIGATGMVQPDIELRSMRLENYVVAEDFLRLAVELLVFALLLHQTATLVTDICVLGLRTYFGSLFNCGDVVRQVATYILFALYVHAMRHPLRVRDQIFAQPDGLPDFGKSLEPSQSFINFPSLAKREYDYVLMSGICILLTVLMLFRGLMPFPKR